MKIFFKNLILLVLTSYLLIGCTSNESKDIEATMINGDYSITTLPKDLFVIGKIDDDSFICTDTNQINFYSYNLKTNLKSNISTSSKDNFIKKAISNEDWIVWIENDTYKEDISNRSYKWEIHAKNIKTNSEISIDKSNFLNNKYDIPTFVSYTPNYLDISSDNKIVYSKMFVEPDGRIVNKLILFNLNDLTSSEILSTIDVKESFISGLSIYNNKILWSECANYDKTGKLSTQFKNSYIYSYDINNTEIINITTDGYYSNPILNGKTIVAEKLINDKELAISNIVLIDIDSKNITNIVNKNSIIYSDHKSYSESLSYVVDINDKYIAWQNLLYNSSIYDIKNNTFINLLNSEEVSTIVSINKLFDNKIFLTVEKDNNTFENLCIELNS
jgi:hypothetical protein